MRVLVRPRVDTDMAALIRIAALVQETDGYPGRRPRDLGSFLDAPDALGAWVVECDGVIAGHVALHRESLPVVMARAATVLQRERSDLAVVARLLVDPSARRRGVGRVLLETAADHARRRGLHPVLDVATDYDGANALYRSCGWRNVGEVTMVFRDGATLKAYVYVAP